MTDPGADPFLVALVEQDAQDPLMSQRSGGKSTPRTTPRSRKGSAWSAQGSYEKRSGCRGMLQSIFLSSYYEPICICWVIANAFSIWMQLDHPTYLNVDEWLIVNLFFWSVFTIESSLKLAAFGFQDFAADRFNLFDVLVSVLAGIQIAAYYSYIDNKFYSEYSKFISGDLVQLLRLFRLLRLARIFKQLEALITSFFTSMKSLSWILVLAMMWFYLCACLGTVFLGRRQFLPNSTNQEEPEGIKFIRTNFQTIPQAMFALFEVMTLEGWCEYVRPLLDTRPEMVFFFLFFIFVTTFFLLNLVTAVVVDRTVDAQRQQGKDESLDSQEDRTLAIDEIYMKIYNQNKQKDVISHENFTTFIHDPSVAQKMVITHFSKEFLQSMFQLMDHNNDGKASLSRMRQLWVACNKPLDTSTFVRFQINLARRMEYVERLTLTVIHIIEEMHGSPLALSDEIQEKASFLEGSKRSCKQVAGYLKDVEQ